jgi:acyl transferase domain-containing protein/acyl carrier protein
MKQTVFLFSGEGTHSPDTRFRLLTHSPLWKRIGAIVQSTLALDLEPLWHEAVGHHRCPHSPLLTVISQICLSDLWRRWGFRPDVVVGHSTGELAAAYQAGFYTLEETLLLANRIGTIAARRDGAMLHGWLPDEAIAQLPVNLSSFNFKDSSGTHVTVSGYVEEMQRFQEAYPDFVQLKIPHPWHHPDYGRFTGQLTLLPARRVDDGSFVSGVTTAFETQLKPDHWHDWLVNPIDFIQTMQTLAARYGDDHLDIIEIGFHPVLEKCCHIFSDYTYVSSMFRGEDDFKWIFHQRRKLDPDVLRHQIKPVIDAYQADLDYGQSLAYQGFTSLKFTELSVVLQPFFPSLAPHDFYRYKTIDQLIDRFGVEKPLELAPTGSYQRNPVVIAAMSCRFPAAVETLPQFWEMLAGQTDQVRPADGRGRGAAGFLDGRVAAFDHGFFNIPSAEARTMDPQQALALELTEMLWRDAGIDPKTLDRSRVGVYLGVWSQEYGGDRHSVYYPTGTNPSIIASRVSYQYDLRGPSWVSNTACSSSLVAIHYAAKDIEAGRVDYAIAGGVNMLLDDAFTTNMRNSGFLSADDRCKAFDDSANGYVRAEGGGLVLLANRSLADTYYAELTGSAINQNGGRSQVITAPHPEAQEELIAAACRDAGITPDRIAYVECHGTGTKIGDPIELSALQNTVARNRSDTCYVGSVKSNIGHLESAAGVAGLIKSAIALNRGLIPPNLHFMQPNQHIDFDAYPIRVVTEPTPIDHEAAVGVSSFGFGGANAHIVLKGVAADRRKPIRSVEVPFDRQRALPLAVFLNSLEPEASPSTVQPFPPAGDATVQDAVSRDVIDHLVTDLFFQLTRVEAIDPGIELTDQGLDSMSGTELISRLEESLNVDLGPEILFEYPLREQFVDQVYALVAKR